MRRAAKIKGLGLRPARGASALATRMAKVTGFIYHQATGP